ncbi:Putative sulfate transporter ychM [Budvicia aquatica]|uniref:Sulfate transporter ychM n=1 Tax=Budvicia aquatica TaxID=82979 RepID=A0A484ZMI7_9GAMM|nr:Putative sulfate transporter ychM [Budvicia aquatica]
MPTISWADTLIATVTLGVLIFWPRLKLAVPGHLPALLAGTAIMAVLAHFDHQVATIGSRFSYMMPDGTKRARYSPDFASVCTPLEFAGCRWQGF